MRIVRECVTLFGSMKRLFVILSAALFVGCSDTNNDQPKAEAEIKVDVEGARNDMEKAFDKAGKEIKKGAGEVKEALKETGEAIKEKTEEAREKLSGDKNASVEVEVKKD